MEAKTLRLIGSCYNHLGKMGAAFKYMNSSWTKYTYLGEKLGQLLKQRYVVKMSLVLFALKLNNREAFCEHYGAIPSFKKMISTPPKENLFIWSYVFNKDQRDIRSHMFLMGEGVIASGISVNSCFFRNSSDFRCMHFPGIYDLQFSVF